MTLNQFKYFVTLAESMSFTEAAKCLFITQPALSRQINAMEQEIGAKLFVREKSGLKLTPGGSVLYNKLPKILEEYQEIIEETITANEGYEGMLNIGFLDVYDTSDYFPEVMLAFGERYPKIQLNLYRLSLRQLPQLMNEGKVDLIVTYGFSLYDKPEVIMQEIHKFHSCVMLPINHPLADEKELPLTKLKDEIFVVQNEGASEEGYSYIQTLFRKANIHPRMKKVETMENVMLWVENGRDAGITTDVTIEKNNKRVRIIPIPNLEEHEMVIAWKKQNYNPAISIFLELYQKINGKAEQ